MITTTIRVPGTAAVGSAKALVLTAQLKRKRRRLVLPWIPDEVQRDNIAREWEQVTRPGRKPLAYSTGRSLPVINLTVMVADRRNAAVQNILNELDKIADTGRSVVATLGPRRIGEANITGLSVRETDWNARGLCTRAEVDVELTTVSPAVRPVGPVTRPPKKLRNIRGTETGMAR